MFFGKSQAADLLKKMYGFGMERTAFITWTTEVGIEVDVANEIYFCLLDWCAFHADLCAAAETS